MTKRTKEEILNISEKYDNTNMTIEIMNVRELPRDYAKIEIANYINSIKDRKVYISEIVEELCLDIELVENIVKELKNEKI